MPASDPFLDLYWIPVGAGTHFQHASLVFYEAIASRLSRRPPATLYHSALKLRIDGTDFTLELLPAAAHQLESPLMTGPVGVRGADRLRLFRYQLLLKPGASLPDEQWAGEPHRLTVDESAIRRLVELGPSVPAYVWGRRVPRTTEMWTSDSAISWLLCRAGIDASAIPLPPGGRAPGWHAGIQLATSPRRRTTDSPP